MRLLTQVLTTAILIVFLGCASATRWEPAGRHARGAAESAAETSGHRTGDADRPVSLEFLRVYENIRSAPYFPLEGVGGVTFYGDGTLYFCDEKGGRVHGYDAHTDDWFQFDNPGTRFFQPVDLCIDQFSVLVLDMDGRTLLRYDLGGVYQDQLINFDYLDPGYDRRPSSFDVDLDGRMVFTDGAEDQILMVDSYLELHQRVGGPGSHPEQFREPSGVVYMRDGGFIVADRANRRLQRFNRLGYHEATVGGEFDVNNRLLTPQGMDMDDAGNLFVADSAGGMIHVFDSNLSPLFRVGSELGLLAAPVAPIDLAVGPDDLLAVTDRGRQAVLIYRIRYE